MHSFNSSTCGIPGKAVYESRMEVLRRLILGIIFNLCRLLLGMSGRHNRNDRQRENNSTVGKTYSIFRVRCSMDLLLYWLGLLNIICNCKFILRMVITNAISRKYFPLLAFWFYATLPKSNPLQIFRCCGR